MNQGLKICGLRLQDSRLALAHHLEQRSPGAQEEFKITESQSSIQTD